MVHGGLLGQTDVGHGRRQRPLEHRLQQTVRPDLNDYGVGRHVLHGTVEVHGRADVVQMVFDRRVLRLVRGPFVLGRRRALPTVRPPFRVGHYLRRTGELCLVFPSFFTLLFLDGKRLEQRDGGDTNRKYDFLAKRSIKNPFFQRKASTISVRR